MNEEMDPLKKRAVELYIQLFDEIPRHDVELEKFKAIEEWIKSIVYVERSRTLELIRRCAEKYYAMPKTDHCVHGDPSVHKAAAVDYVFDVVKKRDFDWMPMPY